MSTRYLEIGFGFLHIFHVPMRTAMDGDTLTVLLDGGWASGAERAAL